ncbi:DUF4198 domain-containing protein [Aliiglaciecola sp. NS0011-25]|uniref:DUF4198 domain-containing protein n=1 Tax=Aliiglaciecola sp. NS0011-25 TaxID=3127654 RepID=UPI00310A13A0
MKYLLCVACLFLYLLSLQAAGHTPYFKPHSFEPVRGDLITLDAAFAEKFFVPEVAFANSIYLVTAPDGKTSTPDSLAQFKSRVVVEHALKQDGTYRFSTGRRLGRLFKFYELDGKRKAMKDPTQAIPEGAKLLSFFQSLTLAETYVSKGGPNNAALQPHGEGLEFVATSHPNELFVGEPLALLSLFNGQPLADLKVDVFLAKDQFTQEKATVELHSDANGKFIFTPETAGTYLLLARHRSEAPVSSQAKQISNTYTLVVEAFE